MGVVVEKVTVFLGLPGLRLGCISAECDNAGGEAVRVLAVPVESKLPNPEGRSKSCCNASEVGGAGIAAISASHSQGSGSGVFSTFFLGSLSTIVGGCCTSGN